MSMEYSSKERLALWVLAIVSFLTVNLAFIYALLFSPETLASALKNPVSLAFIAEAFLLMGAFSYLLTRWGVSKSSWRWFVALSLVGSMGFALPIVLLWPSDRKANEPRE
jgi:hypothetical protein